MTNYCTGLITPASLAGYCVRLTISAKLAGTISSAQHLSGLRQLVSPISV
jgi:hypothetical protein